MQLTSFAAVAELGYYCDPNCIDKSEPNRLFRPNYVVWEGALLIDTAAVRNGGASSGGSEGM